MIMLTGVCIAFICFASCAFFVPILLNGGVPWIGQAFKLKVAYVYLAALYIPIALSAFVQILTTTSAGLRSKTVRLAACTVGASLGVFTSWTFAIFSENGLKKFHSSDFHRLVLGDGHSLTVENARTLLPQAELLGIFNSFLDSCLPCVVVFSLLALLIIEVCIKFRTNSIRKGCV